ncbi:hypothetical protein DOY81_005434 [Sarcophaga bullata]|nr:hypothetical protein DOY81_005434 [Sarcophaga bullata]
MNLISDILNIYYTKYVLIIFHNTNCYVNNSTIISKRKHQH